MKDFQYGMIMLSLAGVLFLIFFGNAIVNGAENQAKQPEFLHTIITILDDPSPITQDEIKVICAIHGGNLVEIKTRTTPSGYLLARHDCYKTILKPNESKPKELRKQKA